MTRIFLTGDTHHDYDIAKLNSKNFPLGKKLTKDDYVIVLGDFGLLWSDVPYEGTEKHLTKWYNSKPWTTLFIDGNHENFNRINNLAEVSMFGSTVGEVSSSIYHLKRGNIYDIGGYKLLTIGGAESIDKRDRTEGKSWWPQELISYKEQEYIFQQIDKFSKVDYVLTHTCPTRTFNDMGELFFKKDDPTMKILDEVMNRVTFKHWYFGHFHNDCRINDYFTVLFDNIIELGV